MIHCINRDGAHLTEIGTDTAGTATPSPGSTDKLSLTVEGPAGPETVLAARVAGLVKDLVHASLAGSAESPAADRALGWLAAVSDGHQHNMVFGGLELDVTPRGSAPSTITGIDVWVYPASAHTN